VPREGRESSAARETVGGSRSAGCAASSATRPSSRPSPKPATGCYGSRFVSSAVTQWRLVDHLDIHDSPVDDVEVEHCPSQEEGRAGSRGRKDPGAGFGIEALAEVVTATAAGDKAKVAHRASSRLFLLLARRSFFPSSLVRLSAVRADGDGQCVVTADAQGPVLRIVGEDDAIGAQLVDEGSCPGRAVT
jgi:hypothetical protein